MTNSLLLRLRFASLQPATSSASSDVETKIVSSGPLLECKTAIPYSLAQTGRLADKGCLRSYMMTIFPLRKKPKKRQASILLVIFLHVHVTCLSSVPFDINDNDAPGKDYKKGYRF